MDGDVGQPCIVLSHSMRRPSMSSGWTCFCQSSAVRSDSVDDSVALMSAAEDRGESASGRRPVMSHQRSLAYVMWF